VSIGPRVFGSTVSVSTRREGVIEIAAPYCRRMALCRHVATAVGVQQRSFAAMVGPTPAHEYGEVGMSLRQIATKLTEDGINTASGGQWTATAVRNLLDWLT
jgi:hypothetical protein